MSRTRRPARRLQARRKVGVICCGNSLAWRAIGGVLWGKGDYSRYGLRRLTAYGKAVAEERGSPRQSLFILTIYRTHYTTSVYFYSINTYYVCAESCRVGYRVDSAPQRSSASARPLAQVLRSTGTVSAWDFGTTTRGSRVRGSRRSTRHSGRRWPRRRRSVGSPATWQAGTRP